MPIFNDDFLKWMVELKVQTIIECVRQKCTNLSLTSDLSIDGQMIPFTGSTLLQFVNNKPNPDRLKKYILTTIQDLVINFIVYQGVKT